MPTILHGTTIITKANPLAPLRTSNTNHSNHEGRGRYSLALTQIPVGSVIVIMSVWWW